MEPSTPQSPPPRSLVLNRVAVAALFFANAVMMAAWVSRIPAIQLKLHLSTGRLGLAMLSVAVGALLGMPAAGWLSARFGSRYVTLGGLAMTSIALPLIALAPGLGVLSLALGLTGMGNGTADVAMNTQAVGVQRLYGRSIMPSFHALWSIGGMVGAGVGGWCAKIGIAPLHHFTGAAIAMLVVALLAQPGLLKSDTDHDVAEEEATSRLRLPSKALFALGVIAFCSMLGEGAMADWSAVYLHRALLTTAQIAAYGYAAFSFAMAIGRFAGDSLTHRFGAVALVRACGLLSAVGLALALSFGTVWAAMAGFALVGAGYSIIVPLCFSAAGNMPGTQPGPSIASVSTVGYTGFLIGPPVIGFAADYLSLRGALWIVVVVSAFVIVLAKYVAPAQRSRSADATA